MNMATATKPQVSKALQNERRIVRAIVKDAIADGCVVSVHDGEEWMIKRSDKITHVMGAIMATGSDNLKIRDAATGDYVGTVAFIYGNGSNGADVIADYTLGERMEKIMERGFKMACALC